MVLYGLYYLHWHKQKNVVSEEINSPVLYLDKGPLNVELIPERFLVDYAPLSSFSLSNKECIALSLEKTIERKD